MSDQSPHSPAPAYPPSGSRAPGLDHRPRHRLLGGATRLDSRAARVDRCDKSRVHLQGATERYRSSRWALPSVGSRWRSPAPSSSTSASVASSLRERSGSTQL